MGDEKKFEKKNFLSSRNSGFGTVLNKEM